MEGHHHDHGHEHEHHHHDHGRTSSWWRRVTHAFRPHSHDHADKIDEAAASSAGMRALVISLAGLGLTAVVQAVVALTAGSVALLGDTLHNASDALTAVPLAIAFTLGRRAASRRYTWGYGRAEDLAGVAVVLMILASAALAAWAAVDRLAHPSPVRHLWAVAAAALVGFAGNELVAQYRMRVGRRIGSAALVADGRHARADGFTSLGVLVGAGGVAAGFPAADPLVGLAITAAVLVVAYQAARDVYARLMDAVDPDMVAAIETAAAGTPGVRRVGEVRVRWVGHTLHAQAELAVDGALSVREAHGIAVEAEHRLLHAVPRLASVAVHTDPDGSYHDAHAPLDHHRVRLTKQRKHLPEPA
jgi:cation diffusion facilitator family transporter